VVADVYYVKDFDDESILLKKSGAFGLSTVTVQRGAITSAGIHFGKVRLVTSGATYEVLPGFRKAQRQLTAAAVRPHGVEIPNA
jgi:hypothetical protein